MTVVSIRARAVPLPLRKPKSISNRLITHRHWLLVEVQDDSGLKGLGYIYAGTNGCRTAKAAVDELIAPLYIGKQAHEATATWDRVYQDNLLTGRRGIVIRALSAVDIAMWDLQAKILNVPLAVALGGSIEKPLPAYASGFFYGGDADPVAAVEPEFHHNVERGFRDHKMKIGGMSIADDARRIAAAIRLIGDKGRLAIDANNAYKSVVEARQAISAFTAAADGAQIWWFEEPLSPDDNVGHAELAAFTEVPIATGEIHQTRWEMNDLLSRRGVSILQPDVGVIGGVTEFMRVARLAEAKGVAVAPHWHHNIHAHLAAATPGSIVIEHFDLEKSIYNFEEMLTPETRMEFSDNSVRIPNRPGIGIEFDEDVVSRYEVA